MALRYFGGAAAGAAVVDPGTGVWLATDTGSVWTAETGGEQLTDLLDGNGAPIGAAIYTDTYGYCQLFAVDTDPPTEVVWVDFTGGQGARVRLECRDRAAYRVEAAGLGRPGGVAALDANGKVPPGQVPELPYAPEQKVAGYREGIDNLMAGRSSAPLVPKDATADGTGDGGYRIVAVGARALASTTWGYSNVGVGADALGDNLDGFHCVAVGNAALMANVGDRNDPNEPGTRNVGVGSNALRYNTMGRGNVAIGRNAAHTNVDGDNNTALGTNAYSGRYQLTEGGIKDRKHGHNNVAVGYRAGFTTETDDNTAVGAAALDVNRTGTRNTAVGRFAMTNGQADDVVAVGYYAAGETVGAFTTAVGANALRNSTTGAGNTAMGTSALRQLTTGQANTGVGTGAGNVLVDGSNNTVVGHSANTATATADATVVGKDATGTDASTALGQAAAAGAAGAVALGQGAVANHAGAVALGQGAVTVAPDTVAMGARSLDITYRGAPGYPVAGAARLNVNQDGNGKLMLRVLWPDNTVTILAQQT